MDPAIITAAAALGGSLVGGLTTFATAYHVQRHQGLRERVMNEVSSRDDLYTEFNKLASELLVDSLDHSLDEPAKLVGIMALTGRIRLTSTPAVLEAAERLISELLASYAKPALDRPLAVTSIPADLVRPLVVFTEACRAERQATLRELNWLPRSRNGRSSPLSSF